MKKIKKSLYCIHRVLYTARMRKVERQFLGSAYNIIFRACHYFDPLVHFRKLGALHEVYTNMKLSLDGESRDFWTSFDFIKTFSELLYLNCMDSNFVRFFLLSYIIRLSVQQGQYLFVRTKWQPKIHKRICSSKLHNVKLIRSRTASNIY